jgi:hypothetical protein
MIADYLSLSPSTLSLVLKPTACSRVEDSEVFKLISSYSRVVYSTLRPSVRPEDTNGDVVRGDALDSVVVPDFIPVDCRKFPWISHLLTTSQSSAVKMTKNEGITFTSEPIDANDGDDGEHVAENVPNNAADTMFEAMVNGGVDIGSVSVVLVVLVDLCASCVQVVYKFCTSSDQTLVTKHL